MCSSCGKKYDRVANIPKKVITPNTPDEYLNQELNKWNGGPQPTPTPEEDWYNNLDTYHITED
jgi:hypothetical protein